MAMPSASILTPENPLPSRRTAILGVAAAAIPTAALATTGLPIPSMVAEPEAELIALGRRFRELLPYDLAAKEECARVADLADERIAELAPDLVGDQRPRNFNSDQWQRFEEVRKQADEETGRSAAFDAWNNGAHKEMQEISRAIAVASATSMAGLLIKAEVLVWNASCWNLRNWVEWDYDEANPIDLIVALFAVAGQPLPEFIGEYAEEEIDT